MWAFQDAKEDILRMAEALRVIGHPHNNTWEEDMDYEDIARFVQRNFSYGDLAFE